MIGSGLLDFVPVPVLWLLTALLSLLAAEIGYRAGLRWKRTHANDKAETGSAMSGAALALLAFYLAFMVSFTVTRFDGRREMVMDEANAIGTTWLRAGYLAEPTRSEVRRILVEYTDERLKLPDEELREAALTRSNELMSDLWAQTEAWVNAGHDTPTTALFVATVNDTIDMGSKRQVAIATWRAPWTMWVATYFVAFAAMGLLGFTGGLQESRNPLALIVLVLVFAMVINLIIDLDRPYSGLLTISQEALIELQQQIGPP